MPFPMASNCGRPSQAATADPGEAKAWDRASVKASRASLQASLASSRTFQQLITSLLPNAAYCTNKDLHVSETDGNIASNASKPSTSLGTAASHRKTE